MAKLCIRQKVIYRKNGHLYTPADIMRFCRPPPTHEKTFGTGWVFYFPTPLFLARPYFFIHKFVIFFFKSIKWDLISFQLRNKKPSRSRNYYFYSHRFGECREEKEWGGKVFKESVLVIQDYYYISETLSVNGRGERKRNYVPETRRAALYSQWDWVALAFIKQ